MRPRPPIDWKHTRPRTVHRGEPNREVILRVETSLADHNLVRACDRAWRTVDYGQTAARAVGRDSSDADHATAWVDYERAWSVPFVGLNHALVVPDWAEPDAQAVVGVLACLANCDLLRRRSRAGAESPG